MVVFERSTGTVVEQREWLGCFATERSPDPRDSSAGYCQAVAGWRRGPLVHAGSSRVTDLCRTTTLCSSALFFAQSRERASALVI